MTPANSAYNAESHNPTDSAWCNQCREGECTCNPVTLDEVLEREYERDANRQRPPIEDHRDYCPNCFTIRLVDGKCRECGYDANPLERTQHLSLPDGFTILTTAEYERLKRVEEAAKEDVKVACELCPIGSMPDPENCGICSVLDLWRALEGKGE